MPETPEQDPGKPGAYETANRYRCAARCRALLAPDSELDARFTDALEASVESTGTFEVARIQLLTVRAWPEQGAPSTRPIISSRHFGCSRS
jgi:hypothetical protein